MKNLLLLITLFTSLCALPSDDPLDPWSVQKSLGRGFDVSWAEFTVNIENYSDLQVLWMKKHGFKTARIRTKRELTPEFLTHLDQVIQDCLNNEITPILAYNCAIYEADPTVANRTADSLWWNTIAKRYQDYSHKLLFNLNIEWSDIGGKDAAGVNTWYEHITPAIRETNPTRIIIYSPMKLSNPAYLSEMVLPTSAGDYVMAEFHSYAAGPSPDSLSANGKPNPKYWTTGTEYEKNLVATMVGTGRDWQDANSIPTWFGAWMAGNNNHGNTFSPDEQVVFATYFVKVLDSLQIPWAINTLDMYYNIVHDTPVDSVSQVLAVLSPNDVSLLKDENSEHSTSQIAISQKRNQLHFTNRGNFRKLSLYTLNGRELLSRNIWGLPSVAIDLTDISTGRYVVKFEGAQSTVQKILITAP